MLKIKEGLNLVEEHILPLTMPDLTILRSRYETRSFSRGESESFRAQWEGKRGEAPQKPAAQFVLMRGEELEENGLGNISPTRNNLAVVGV